MRIDPFWLMVLAEFVLIFAGISLFLYRKLLHIKNAQKTVEIEKGPDFGALLLSLKREMVELENRIENIPEKEDNIFHINLQRKIFELNLDLIKTFHDSLTQHTELDAIAESITTGFRKAVNKGLLWAKEIVEGKNQLIMQKELESIEKDDIIKKLQDKLRKQKQRLADLIGTQEMVDQLKKRIEFLKNRNKDLKEKLLKAKDSDDKDKAYQEIIEELEATNKELYLCVQTLEKENERLMNKIKEYEEGFHNINEDIVEIMKAGNGSSVSSEEIEKLKAEIQEKDKEIERLKTELENLEKEYTALYKEVHS